MKIDCSLKINMDGLIKYMKIATHNVEFLFEDGIHPHSGKEWNYTKEHVDARINHFSKLFSEINADILLLQEVASKSVIERIILESGIDYAYFMAAPDENNVGNAILFKNKESKCVSIPAKTSMPVFVTGDIDTIGARIWSRRDFGYLETIFDNRKLYVINLHIKSNFMMLENHRTDKSVPIKTQLSAADGIIRSEMFRFSQAKKVRELIDSIFANDNDAQVIVGGDFNAEEHNSVYKIVSGGIKNAPDYLYSTSKLIPKEERFSIPIIAEMRLIDHIMFSKSLADRISNVTILNKDISENTNVPPVPTMVGSDHAPIAINID